MKIGYGRVSTRDQNPDAQRDALAAAGCELADLFGYPADPLDADPDDLPGLTPAFTIVGGRVTHDPDKRLVR
jgi:hypothetical protein